MFHQGVEVLNDPWRCQRAFEVAAQAFKIGGEDGAETVPPSGGIEVARTVVEAMVPLDESPDGPESEQADEEISDAFDRVLDAIRVVQRAHHAATGVPQPLCTRENVPPLVPFAVRRAVEGEDGPAWPTDVSVFMPRPPPVSDLPRTLNSNELEELAHRADNQSEGEPFRQVLLQRTAATAAADVGNYFQAVVSAAISIEVLLSDVHAFVLWEQCVAPLSAGKTLGLPFKRRFTTELPALLGGTWTLTGRGPVADYARDLLSLRHRCVHVGYEPTPAEASATAAAAVAMERFIGDRLSARIDELPITAIQYCGVEGLRERGALRHWVEKLMDEPDGHCCIEADGVRVVQARGSIRASGASPLIFHGGFQAVTLGPSDAGCWLARLDATVPVLTSPRLQGQAPVRT
jgi:hypothetical protein